LAWEMVLALEVVVAELDEHVVGFGLEASLPESLLAEGFGAGASFGHVHAIDLRRHVCAEPSAVAGVVRLGRVADQIDADGGGWGANRCGGWIEGSRRIALRECL